MNGYFLRLLADYVQYHRDPRNCAMHVLGIIFLFLAAVLPPTMWPISLFGVHITMATLMVLPVLIYWIALDAMLGLAIVAVACLLLWTSAMIVDNASGTVTYITSAALIAVGVASQVIGHRVFERRQPALADNPAHLLMGPMFIMAKLFIALGYRDDLAAIIEPPAQGEASALRYPRDTEIEPPART